MRFMNDYDIDYALRRFLPYGGIVDSPTPNRARAAVIVNNLADWTNQNSDGWAYWSKPCNSARSLIGLVYSTTNVANDEQGRIDATDAELTAALRPVKAFLTRHKHMVSDADRAEILAPLGL